MIKYKDKIVGTSPRNWVKVYIPLKIIYQVINISIIICKFFKKANKIYTQ